MEMISCVSAAVKKSMLDILSDEVRKDPTGMIDELIDQLLEIPSCDDNMPIGFGKMKKSKKTKSDGAPRKKSAYNEFVRTCMKGKRIKETGIKASEAMKECAVEWNSKKSRS